MAFENAGKFPPPLFRRLDDSRLTRRRGQLFGTLTLSLIAASLGLAAAMNVGSATSLDSHKVSSFSHVFCPIR